jgi:hypothetical protein
LPLLLRTKPSTWRCIPTKTVLLPSPGRSCISCKSFRMVACWIPTMAAIALTWSSVTLTPRGLCLSLPRQMAPLATEMRWTCRDVKSCLWWGWCLICLCGAGRSWIATATNSRPSPGGIRVVSTHTSGPLSPISILFPCIPVPLPFPSHHYLFKKTKTHHSPTSLKIPFLSPQSLPHLDTWLGSWEKWEM